MKNKTEINELGRYIIGAIVIIAMIISFIYLSSPPAPQSVSSTTPDVMIIYKDGTSRTISHDTSTFTLASINTHNSMSAKTPVSSVMIWSEYGEFLTSLGYGTTAWKVTFNDGSVDVQYVKGNKLQLGTIYGGSNCQSLASQEQWLKAFDANKNGLLDIAEVTYVMNWYMAGSLSKEISVAVTQFNQYGCSFNPLTTPAPAPTPAPVSGTLSISSNPSGIGLTIPELGVNGVTPYTSPVMAGSYTIRITAAGYNSYSTVTQVIVGQTTTINAALTQVTAAPTTAPTIAPPAPSASVVWTWGDSGSAYTVMSDGTLIKNGNTMGNYGSVSAAQAAAGADYTATHPPAPTPAPTPVPTLSTPTPTPTTAPMPVGVFDVSNNRQISSITARVYINPVISGTLPSGSRLVLQESNPNIGNILSANGGSIQGFTSKLTNNILSPNVDNLVAERTFSENELAGILTPGSTISITVRTHPKTVQVINSNGAVEASIDIPAKSLGSINVIKR